MRRQARANTQTCPARHARSFQPSRNGLRGLVLSLACAFLPGTGALAQAPGGQMPTMQVGTITLEREAVPYVLEVPGRAVAYQQVSVRPRVSGALTAILYTPGKPLAVGDPLYQMDDASYAAAVAEAEASVAEASANLPLKLAALDRIKSLKGTGYTQSDLENAESALASAQAALKSAEATPSFAQTPVSWAPVRSPIGRVAEVSSVSMGDLVSASQSDALTTITTLDPIEVELMQASASLLAIRRQFDNNVITRSDSLRANLTLEDGEIFEGTGEMIAPSATVSTTTGTISARFRFDNPDRKILPGMFLRGTLELGTINAFLIPQRAGSMNADGTFTLYLVDDEGVVHQTKVTPTDSHENAWIVTEGLSEGDRLVIDGQKSLSDGMTVSPVAAQLDENGLVVTEPDPDAADSSASDTTSGD